MVAVEKVALLIGSEILNLRGPHHDLDIMQRLLESRGFEIRRHQEKTATRDAVVAAYRELIEDATSDHCVVVYASGHGVRAQAGPGDSPALDHRLWVPTDYPESTPDDLRGITATELSLLQWELTVKTRNVTTIWDSCYSSRMSRDVGVVSRALPRARWADVEAHLIRRGVIDQVRSRRDAVGNPWAVRLVACGPEESAYEYENRDGIVVGAFTEALSDTLEEVGQAGLTWAEIIRRVRYRVRRLFPNQWPRAEGPYDRLPFTTDVPDLTGVLPVEVDLDGQVRLAAGRIAGVAPGDVYAVQPAGAPFKSLETSLARATVTQVSSTDAVVELHFLGGATELPRNARAHPVELSMRRRPVAVVGTGPEAETMRTAVAEASHVRIAEPAEADVPVSAHVSGGTVELRDPQGALTLPRDATAMTGVVRTVRDLNRYARALTLEELTSGTGTSALGASFEVEFGRVVDGQPVPITAPGNMVFCQEHLYVRMRNTSPNRLFFFMFDVGVSRRISLSTNTNPEGLALDRDEEWWVGRSPATRELVGLELEWPEGFAGTKPRLETIIVIVTHRAEDLSVLQQEGVQKAISGDESPLWHVVAQVALGGGRELKESESEQQYSIRYAVRQFPIMVHPAPPPQEEATRFRYADLPDRSLRVLPPQPTTPPPAGVTLRLTDLSVSEPIAGGAALRVDALVLTGSPDGNGGHVAYHAFTGPAGVGGVPQVLFDGHVRDHLDLAIWLSPSRAGHRPLADLLAGQVITPSAAVDPAIAAMTATAKFIDLAHGLLSGQEADVVAIYRTCLLSGEAFGTVTGREAVSMPGVSLTFEVLPR
ncbi:caspase family protein [Nonomuraea sp. PA05]|uniref:caspase family protein n=1 Tax=Nonomuraea sp. PA05 TaxID=2604466 RepID=UPI0011D86E21|nr:caspase family protein [Nonomuraea sp. PA05]TYB64892.1 caspase family protein [Nonomuraea sp. PA05]